MEIFLGKFLYYDFCVNGNIEIVFGIELWNFDDIVGSIDNFLVNIVYFIFENECINVVG